MMNKQEFKHAYSDRRKGGLSESNTVSTVLNLRSFNGFSLAYKKEARKQALETSRCLERGLEFALKRHRELVQEAGHGWFL